MIDLDRVDLRILSILQREGRISNIDLSQRVGLSPTPCHRRVHRLEEENVIQSYAALLNPQMLGLGVSVFVQVRLGQQRATALASFENVVATSPEIMECHMVSGECDYLLRVQVRDVSEFKRFVREQLSNHPSVAQTSSAIVLDSPKQTTALPLPAIPKR